MSLDELDRLRGYLAQAQRRLVIDIAYSPAWAATIEWVEELEEQLRNAEPAPDEVPETRPAS